MQVDLVSYFGPDPESQTTGVNKLASRLLDILEILESITDSFFAVDENWRITYLNPQAEGMVRYTPEGSGTTFTIHLPASRTCISGGEAGPRETISRTMRQPERIGTD